MTTVYDVPATQFIERLSVKLRDDKRITPPEWAEFVKTGVHTERAPKDKDWWYIRMAAVMRKVYIMGPIGVSRLRAEFGGKSDKGSSPYKARKGSGAIARNCLVQLETLEYVLPYKKRGRIVTPKGRSLIDNTAHEVFKELVLKNPDMKKYAK